MIDEEVLKAQAAMIAESNPVAAFLDSDTFKSVVPDGLEVRVYIVGLKMYNNCM